MKKIICLVVVVLLLGLVFTGCQGAATATTTSASASNAMESSTAMKPKVGIIVMELTGNSFQIDMANAGQVAAEAAGFEVTLHAPQTFGDYQQQVDIIEDLITKQYDLIILDPNHPSSLNPAIQQAEEAGIPVILIDNAVDDPNLPLTYIGTGNEAGAYVGTKYLCEKIGGKGNIVHLEGEAGNPNAALRKEGMLRALEEYPNVKLVTSQNAHWSQDGGMQVMENALTANQNDIAGVFAANDDSGLGALKACQDKGLDIPIVAFDGTQAAMDSIKDGGMLATIAQFPTRMAEYAVAYGAAYLNYFKPLSEILPRPFPTWVDSGVAVVDATNVDQFSQN